VNRVANMSREALLGSGGVVLVVLLVVWWMLLMSPAGHKLSSLRSQHDQLVSQAGTLQGQLTSLQEQKAHSATLDAQQARNQLAMPPTADLPGLITQLDSLASSTGVNLSSISPSPPAAASAAGGSVAGGSYQSMSLSLAFAGTYGQDMAFLQGLYQLNRLVVINSVSLSGGGDKSSPNAVLTGSVSAQVFTSPATATHPANG